MIIRKEFNIYPSLYESIISQIPGIISCAMVGIYTDTINDEKVILYIESHTLHSLQDKKNIFQLLKT
jgi:acyl-CoA synthetase (AMP-forming)/AMP-acid ligase II